MAIKKKNLSVNLNVSDTPNQNVVLTITIGNAQIGGSVVKWKNLSSIIKKGEITNLDLGRASELKGKTLKVVTNILDVNEQTNGVVATYYFNNAFPVITTVDDKVDAAGDIFSFIIDYNFN